MGSALPTARHAIKDIAWTRLCATLFREDICVFVNPESLGLGIARDGYNLYCIRDRESFGVRGGRGEEGKPVAIYAKRYCPDKAVRFCSAAVRQYGSMNACLSTRALLGTIARAKKAERVRERIETCGTITHLEEYVEGGVRSFERIAGMIDTRAQGVHILHFQIHFQEVIYNGCHG